MKARYRLYNPEEGFFTLIDPNDIKNHNPLLKAIDSFIEEQDYILYICDKFPFCHMRIKWMIRKYLSNAIIMTKWAFVMLDNLVGFPPLSRIDGFRNYKVTPYATTFWSSDLGQGGHIIINATVLDECI